MMSFSMIYTKSRLCPQILIVSFHRTSVFGSYDVSVQLVDTKLCDQNEPKGTGCFMTRIGMVNDETSFYKIKKSFYKKIRVPPCRNITYLYCSWIM